MGIYFSKKPVIAIAIVTYFFSLQPVAGQRIDSVLYTYASQFPQEHIYIQFDKPAYAPGETIWFKAYLLAGIAPSIISKNFYLDWMDDQGNILQHSTAPVSSSSAFGQFLVPEKFSGGAIYVKAYTNWMLNFDSSFLYRKGIRIFQKTPAKKAAEAPVAAIQFFAEGGDAITGIQSKMAFKANDQYGKPVKIKGLVVNNKNTVIDSLRTMHDGMGYFFLFPQAGETYTAKWYDEQKVLHQDKLPVARSTGISLQVKPGIDKQLFTITGTANAATNLQELHVVVTMQQEAVYLANINLTASNMISGTVPVTNLPTGVLQYTVFDANWIPVAERISFVNSQDAVFSPEVGFSALGLSKRGRNMLVIAIPDSMQANLSVSVTDADAGTDSSDNIISRMLLTGDLKGYVYNAPYYFSDTTAEIAQNLDLVLLTHGWRKYNWADITKGKLPIITHHVDTAYLTLTGKVFGASAMQLRQSGSIITIIKTKDSSQQVEVLPLKTDGRFSYPGHVFFDTVQVYYQFPDKSLEGLTEVTLSNGLLTANEYPSQTKNNETISWTDTTGDYRNYMLAQKQLHQWNEEATLKDVVVTAKVKTPLEKLEERYPSGLFKGDAYQFDIINDEVAIRASSVLSYLQGRVAGLTINLTGNKPSLTWRGATPLVYLDEVQADAQQVLSLPMTSVAYVKVFRPPFTGGFGGTGGAISVYTRKGGDKENTASPQNALPYKFVAGYTAIKEFYSPNYGTINQKNEREDLRTTLYWNPMVVTTDTKHILRLEFYNNDISNSFRVVVEGMTSDGKLTSIEKVVE